MSAEGAGSPSALVGFFPLTCVVNGRIFLAAELRVLPSSCTDVRGEAAVTIVVWTEPIHTLQATEGDKRMQRVPRAFMAVLAAASACSGVCLHAQDFKKQVIYQVVTDRFHDGDTTNDNPAESTGLFDSSHTNWQAYWGGDLKGIQQKIAYIKGMGATAVWVSPVANNENLNCASSGVSAPYH